MRSKNSQGSSRQKLLESAKKQAIKRGATEEELAKYDIELSEATPAVVPGTEYVLAMFHELDMTRPWSEVGPRAILNDELSAYCSLNAVHLDPWEVEALRMMDTAYLEEAYKIQKARDTASRTKIGAKKSGVTTHG